MSLTQQTVTQRTVTQQTVTQQTDHEPSSASAGHGQGGFTLLEILIATTLFLFVMMIAAQVLLEANTLLIRSSNEERNILPGAALALVRHDIHNATNQGGFPNTPWFSTPLVLQHQDGATVYAIDDNCLMRKSINEDTVVIGERCILKNAVSLKWRYADNQVLEVQVDTTIWEEPSGVARLDDLRMRSGRTTIRSHSLTALARGSKQGAAW
jgi:prepilin-type N-terminal cleavage/methylation domain-containing protein